MSRYVAEGDYDPQFNNEYELRRANFERALKGKRGRKALRELREALLALPERKLIAGALCTVDLAKRAEAIPVKAIPSRDYAWDHPRQDFVETVAAEGVCAIGAYLWHTRVKNGMHPREAFDSLPTYEGGDDDDALYRTASLAANDLHMVYDLAWDLAYRNDETLASCTPEERWTKYMAWLDQELGVESERAS